MSVNCASVKLNGSFTSQNGRDVYSIPREPCVQLGEFIQTVLVSALQEARICTDRDEAEACIRETRTDK